MADSAKRGDHPLRIFLWANPRSLSTVLLKCIAHMEGAQVWMEPYATVYINRVCQDQETFNRFPGMKIFLDKFQRAMERAGKHQYEGGNLVHSANFTYYYVREQLEKPLDEGTKFLLVKDGLMDAGSDEFPDLLPKVPFKHTFLIRHPHRTALSMRNLYANLFDHKGDIDDFDVGPGVHPFMEWEMLPRDPLYKVWNYVTEHIDPDPLVIDADDFQNHPGDVLKKYCEAVGIPWEDEYVSWDASDEYVKYMHGSLEQMIWGKEEGVYAKAMTSSKFEACSAVPATIPAKCEGYAEEFREGYKAMYEHRIKPDDV